MRPAGTTGESITISLPSNPRYLGLLRQVVGRAADLLGFGEDEKQGVVLAANEGCANIIEHCYGMDGGHRIDVTLGLLANGLRIEFRDYGEHRADRIRECSGGGEDEPRGLGIRLMKSVMDEVSWRPAGRLGTRLTMVKRRAAGSRA